MNRPFAVKIRGNGNKLHFLLDEYGLSSRSLDDFNDLPTIINEDIDYEKVNKTIRRKRENSIDYIKSCLAMVKNDKEH